jgi:hypothetical protein
MSLLATAQRAQLLANGKANAARNAPGQPAHDFVPVVKLFTPDANATWLVCLACATSALAAPNSATFR